MHKKLPNIFVFLDKYDYHFFENNITNIGVIYRNYNDESRERKLDKIVKECKKKRCQIFVSNDIKLAIKFRTNGIYIPSFNKKKQFGNLENRNLTILGSAHNQKQIQEKINQKCKAIFLSPIFNVKKSKYFLDVHKFNFLTRANKTDFFALGGIKETNINKIKLLHIKGFAGIRMFKKKPAFKRPVFLKNNFF
tara:strand:+ start:464 stop:1042 length:579 start_codon:yes stop_codon:yes gene_type:complete